MKNRFTTILASALLALCWLMPVQADEHGGDVAMAAMITAKSGHESELLDAIEAYHKWVAQFDGHMEFNWYEVMTGPNTGQFVARTGGHHWADFDAEYDWQEEAGENFEKNVAPHIDSITVQMTKDMPDVSHWPEDFEGYNMYQVEDWYIKNGQYGAFNKGLKRIVDALKAGGFPHYFGFSSVESGGYGGQLSLVLPNKGWAGMDSSDPSFASIMIKELGGEDEFNTFMAEWGDTFKTGTNRMVKYLPDASDYGND